MKACADGEIKANRSKLIVLGASGDGKTSLIDRMLGKKFKEEHIITNALDTEFTVEIRQCNEAWVEYESDPLELLDKGVTHSIGESMARVKVQQPTENKSQVDGGQLLQAQPDRIRSKDRMSDDGQYDHENKHPRLDTRIAFDELSKEAKNEAKYRLRQVQQVQTSPEPLGPSLVLSIWDLGGQVVYYILHHIFLRCHCIYILVVNLSKPLDTTVPYNELPPHSNQQGMKYYQQIEYWLNMVLSCMTKQRASVEKPKPTIIVVGTHKDELDPNPETQSESVDKYFHELKKLLMHKAHYKLVHSTFIAVDNKGGHKGDFTSLRKLVFELINDYFDKIRPRPVRWLRLEKKLHELKKDSSLKNLDQNLVSRDRAMEYGATFHIQTDSDLETFLQFHHLTGDFTYCPGNNLKNYIVPHPQWLVNVLRAVITLDQFYPSGGACYEQEKHQLQRQGLLKTNGLLLKEVWKSFIKDDTSGAARKYLLNLMVQFDLAVKYDETRYLIPCLLPISHSNGQNVPKFPSGEANLPALYFRFHSVAESYEDMCEGFEAYDNFLPHGLFQRLISKCSKRGWRRKDPYQDAITFRSGNVEIVLCARSTWIVMNVIALSKGVNVQYSTYFSQVVDSIKDIMSRYHTNMWYELALNPCAKLNHECLQSIGCSSIGDERGTNQMTGVKCDEHFTNISTCEFEMWFSQYPCRVLTIKDLNNISKDLTDPEICTNLALELGDDVLKKFEAEQVNSQEITRAVFNMLQYWYNQQIYKVHAFLLLCDALKCSGQGNILEKRLHIVRELHKR